VPPATVPALSGTASASRESGQASSSRRASAFHGFSREGGVNDIDGVSIWNTDPAGIVRGFL
jgi:hypothetical protein